MSDIAVTKDALIKWSQSHGQPVVLDASTLNKISKMLIEVWRHNTQYMMDGDGRPFGDKDGKDLDSDGNINEYTTVSETVGYKLFREVLVGIKARKDGDEQLEAEAFNNFDRVFKWADKNLRRDHIESLYDVKTKQWIAVPEHKRDSLLAWRFVPTIDGKKGGIISYREFREPDHTWIDGLDGAPDGDLFTISALYMAALLWHDRKTGSDYHNSAQEMTADARKKYIKKIGGLPHLLGGDEFHYVNGINPSYGFEGFYDIFSELDPLGKNVWQELKCTSMQAAIVGADSVFHKIDGTRVKGKVNVPPNWLSFDGKKYTDMPWFEKEDWYMGWDGARTLWQKAAYYLYDQNELAHKYLTDKTGTVKDYGPYAFLKKEYKKHGALQLGYGVDGTTSDKSMEERDATSETAFSNGIYLGYFYAAGDQKMTKAILDRLEKSYQPEGTFANGKKVELDNYFSDHWAWFGLAMASGLVKDYFNIYLSMRRPLRRNEPHICRLELGNNQL